MNYLPQRMQRKILVAKNGCWNWTGASLRGYGKVRLDGRTQTVHRVVFTLAGKTIPEGQDIDHLCRNRICCNPAHLEAVTRRENLRRSPLSPAAKSSKRTHCARGHERNEQNTYTRMNKGYIQRICRPCHQIACRKYGAAKEFLEENLL